MYYTVCEVAKRLDISPHTLRFYAKEGLLSFVDRDQNGNRIFKESDFERLFMIASLKRAGMSIKQMKRFTELCDQGDPTIPQRLQMIKEQREAVEEQIIELQDALDVLKYKIWLYEVALEAGTTAVHDNMPPEDIPANIRKTKERIRLLCRTLRQGSSAVTAIVTGCRGATPRSPGALLVLTAETALGTVGGGQAEHDIIGPAMEMLRGGAPVQQGWHQCLSAQELRHMGQEFGGEEEILLLRWEPRDLPLAEALLSAMGQNADCSLRLEYDKVHWRGTLLPIAEAHTAPGCFTLKLQEGGRCYVFGGGHVSQALVPLLSGVDFCCVVLDERPDYATPALFPTAEARCGPLPALAAAIPFTTGDSVIIMTRGHQGDYEVLCEALRSPVWYIGMVGSHRKMEATFRRLREDGFTDADLSRIVTPIGLAIDAETPAEIAVSITAQLIQRRAARRKAAE